MAVDSVNENVVSSDSNDNSAMSLAGCFIWLLGGVSLSLFAVLALVLLVLLIGSLALNAYLGWQLADLEVTISQKSPPAPQVIVITSTVEVAAVNLPQEPIPAQPAPENNLTPLPSVTPSPLPAALEVEAQQATVVAITTQTAGGSASAPDAGTVFDPPTATADAASTDSGDLPDTALNDSDSDAGVAAATPTKQISSNNSYELFPIEGSREDRPPAEHGDLNLKLREPTPIEEEHKLVTIDGSGIDPDAPDFGAVYEPDIVQTYAVHGWDWATNSKSELIQDGQSILVGLKTTPGEDVYIPPREQDIYAGKFYATVLYADEDSLTFVYTPHGNVVKGYTIHLLGLQTDPNLIKLFNQSQGNELPGLTLDTPVGIATEELIVAIRDNGTFLDARSLKDWWE